jgi:formate dehydrogenase assembly factor FdhD
VNQSSKRSRDRKGISLYTFTSFCGECWEKHVEENGRREQKKEKKLASTKNKVDEMMKQVRGLYPMEKFVSCTPLRGS